MRNINLSSREKDILQLRYGIKDGNSKTLQEIGNIYNISRERVRQIERKALEKIILSKNSNNWKEGKENEKEKN